MNARIWISSLTLGLALLASHAVQAASVPAETDAAKAVRYTRALEATPLADNALDMRKWLLRWMLETPDYTVLVCNMLDIPDDENGTLSGELMVQMMAGNVAWQIEHPRENDDVSRQMAAVRSALKMYAAYLAKDPKWKLPALDPVIERERNGTLREHVAKKVAAGCNSENGGEKMTFSEEAEPPPFLGGFLRESHMVYPLKVPNGWVMQSEHRYDELESGASVRFQREGDVTGWMDVYFYPIGVISKEQLEKLAAAEREQLVTVWKDAVTGAPLSPLGTFSVPLKADPSTSQPRPDAITAYAADFTYKHRENGKRYNSVLVFMVDRLYAIKLRYSAEAEKLSREQVRNEAEAFARSLLLEVEIISTGDCGAPARALEGGIAEGCVGEEPVQPLVPDGYRELRFEYPAPR
ncbi:hypothetical protein [Stenotrophomonas oahuensis]|uniref:Lipoprotein n=1 Tax=Stenotrophomonas oahuensis TaxID=3003271 RepID=A0ABY9YKT7_9GAMM|nr:hypothetical protein [Stenotrophomonas sp. A5586]WNH51337.1 hypothetical protein PDM29_13295 [Stenotrophomonas sp. A5586]